MSGASSWEVVDIIRDVDGISAEITRHTKRRHRWAVAVFAEFVRPEDPDKNLERTPWIDAQLIPTVLKVLGMANDRVNEFKKRAMAGEEIPAMPPPPPRTLRAMQPSVFQNKRSR